MLEVWRDLPPISDVVATDVPPEVARRFVHLACEEEGYRLMPNIAEFDKLMVQEFTPEEHTFFAVYSARRRIADRPATVMSYAIDTVFLREPVGEGHVGANIDPSTGTFAEPVVHWNGTDEDYQRKGLARRRLLSMNAAAGLVYGQVLHSSDFKIEDAALRIWQRLAGEGRAEQFQWGVLPRFRFIT